MRIWFPPAPDASLSELDRALLGLGLSVSFEADEPVIVYPVLLTTAPARSLQTLSAAAARTTQALTTYSTPAGVTLTVRQATR